MQRRGALAPKESEGASVSVVPLPATIRLSPATEEMLAVSVPSTFEEIVELVSAMKPETLVLLNRFNVPLLKSA
jgi:hypothetical protein